jgi:hypothetical protein
MLTGINRGANRVRARGYGGYGDAGMGSPGSAPRYAALIWRKLRA